MQNALEEITFLARSAHRFNIADALRRQRRLSWDELRDRIDCSRTTLQRNLDALSEREWIAAENRQYSLTTTGELAIRKFAALAESIDVAMRLHPFLKWVPRDAFDLDIDLLSDAEVTVTSKHNPYAPVNRHVEALRTADEFRGFTSVIGRDALEQISRRVVEDGAEHELLLTEDALETIRSDRSYADVFETTETGRLTIFVCDRDLPYYLGLFDGFVQIGVEDDESMPRALLESRSPEVYEWAEDVYETYRGRARTLSVA